MSTLLNKITDNYHILTNSQRKVANYISGNIDKIAFYTLDELASKIDVSTTTIIRFARKLGFNGYSDMQQSIQNDVMGKVSLPERLNASINVEQDDLLTLSIKNDLANINSTIEKLSDDILQEAINAIVKAKKVYILGLRSAFSMAFYMESRLGQIKKGVHLVQGIGMLFPEETIDASHGDLCIVYLFPRYTKMTINVVSWLRKKGVKILMITSQVNPSINIHADILLPCAVDSISFKSSFVAPMCITNYLVAAVALKNCDEATDIIAQMEDMLSKGYYHGL